MDIIGIVSFEKDYRLCFFLNQHLNLNLSLAEEKLNIHLNRKEIYLTYYKGYNSDFEFFIFENLTSGTPLFPKFKNINYWLIIKYKSFMKDISEIEQQINKVKGIIGAFKLSNEKELKELTTNEYS
jgi:hypothetical protein